MTENYTDNVYPVSECVFWFYGDVLQISHKDFIDNGDDGFGVENIKDVESLSDFLHENCCESSWFLPSGKTRNQLANDLQALGFTYDKDANDEDLDLDETVDDDDDE